MAKAHEPEDQYGALTPKKMLSWGILSQWKINVTGYFAGGAIVLDTQLSKLQQLIVDEPQDPLEVTKDYLMTGVALANQVEHYMQTGAIYAQVIKGYIYEHVFQYHKRAYNSGQEQRNWATFCYEELKVRKSTAGNYRRLWLLIGDWVRLVVCHFRFLIFPPTAESDAL